MKRLVVLIVLLLLMPAAGVQAQTATPTVSGFPHRPGIIEPENNLYFTISGVWNNLDFGTGNDIYTTSTTAWLGFTIHSSVCFLGVAATSTAASGFAVELNGFDAVAISGQGSPVIGQWPATGYYVWFYAGGSDQTVKIYMKSAGTLAVERIELLSCDDFLYTATPPSTPVPTATILPSSTPPNTPVSTATILPSSTPGVPTATILPSSTPANTPVNTPTEITFPATPTEITFLPTPTEIVFPATPTEINTPVDTPTEITFPPTPTEMNTPVDTPTEINIDPTIDALMTLIAGGPTPNPNTPTPSDTPTATLTPTPDMRVCATVAGTGTPEGQLTCFDYVVTASDVHIGNLLTLIFFSAWGFFLFTVFVLARYRK